LVDDLSHPGWGGRSGVTTGNCQLVADLDDDRVAAPTPAKATSASAKTPAAAKAKS